MFEIAPETKEAAIEAMREALLNGVNEDVIQTCLSGHEEDFHKRLGDAFDVAVDIVKKQFGM